jgi:hypothetical protein
MSEQKTMCEEVQDELGRILDGVAATELYDHLAECDECRDLRHDAQKSLAWVKAAGDDFRPVDGLDDKILAALDARPAKVDGEAAPAAAEAPKTEVIPVANAEEPAAKAEAPAVKTEVMPVAKAEEPKAEEAPKPEEAKAEETAEPPKAEEPKAEPPKADAQPEKAVAIAPKPPANDVEDSSKVIRFVAMGALLVAAAAGIAVMQKGSSPKDETKTTSAKAAPWAGKVTSLARSSLEAKDGLMSCDSGGSCAPLASGGAVARGATIKTDGRTRAELTLEDGTTLAIDRDTEIAFAKGDDRTATLAKGAIVADVAHIDGNKARFTVPGGKIEVLGTKLAVYGDKDRSRVEVSRGVIALSDDAGHTEKVRAGEEGRVARGGKLTVSPTTTLADDFAWSERSFRTPKLEKDNDEPLRGLGELRAKKPGTQDEKDGAVKLVKHDVKVRIVDNVARTEIDETFQNETGDELEGIFRFPLPPDAQIERLALEVNGKLEEGAFVDKDKAAAIWRGVIQNAAPKMPKPVEEIIWVPGPWRDPALLEWKRGGRFELRIFPIQARSARRVIIAYTQTVQPVGGARRYTYPLPHDPKGSTNVASFHLDAKVIGHDSSVPITARGYEKDTQAQGDRVELTAQRFTPSGDLTIEYTLPNASAEVSTWAYQPTTATDSSPYAIIALRPKLPRVQGEGSRDTAIVVDTSRSMIGERLAKARALATSMVAEMDPRDRVVVLACDVTCRSWEKGLTEAGPRAGDAAERFLAGTTADGASDVLAMVRAGRDAANKGGHDKSRALNIVYVGDGGASAGPTKPDHLTAEIRRAIPAGEATVHAVAIGSDADTTLLASVARGGGGVVVPFVPGQRASVAAVSALAATYGVTLQNPELKLPAGFEAVAPANLDTIRAGGETLVVARMTAPSIEGEAVLRGKLGGEAFEQRYPIKVLATSDEGNAFVPRQYAALRIADLERAGGDASKTAIVDLSKRFAVASRYTSLLVLESEAMLTAFGLKRSNGAPMWTGETSATKTTADGTNDVGAEAEQQMGGKAADERAVTGSLDAFGTGGLGLSGVGEGGGGLGRASGAGASPAKKAAGPRAMADDGDFASPPPAAPPPPPAAKPAPMPTTASPPADIASDKADRPREEKRKDVAGGGFVAPRRPPPQPPRPRNWVPMKRVWDRKGTIGQDLTAWHDRESAKVAAAESDALTKPDSRGATKALYALYAQHGRLDRAAEVADRWATRDQLDPEALVARADLAARAGDREAAVRILGGAVDVRPDDALTQNRLAAIYDLLGLRDRACAHRIALAEQRATDVDAQVAAIRCARATGQNELGDRLLSDVPADRRAAVDRGLDKAPPADVTDLRGDVRVEATWDAGEDLDVALVDKNGARISWMGGPGKIQTTARLQSAAGSEGLGIVNLGAGSYVVEVARTRVGSDTPVRGSVTIRAAGETRVVPFVVTGPRVEVGRVDITYTPRLIPVDG